MTTAIAIPFKTDSKRSQMRAMFVALIGAVALMLQATTVDARGAPDSFADLAEQVSPAVVNITTTTIVEASTQDTPMVPPGSPFEDFFKDFMDRGGQGGNNTAPRRSNALGSGFVISEDGYIVTNNHVIEGADEIEIEFFEGFVLPATLVGTDPKTDIAVLKVESDKPLKFVSFGDSNMARMGDWVMAMGNPLGQGFSISAGIVSQRGRALQGAYDDYIQTDAAINRGNSGGPLFNMEGEVIGVNTAILSPNGGSIGIGFSMASNVVSRVTNQLTEFGETRRGWLGVKIQTVSDDVAEAMGLETASGALVTDVPEGPSKDAGLEAGDVILSFDNKDVEDANGLVRTVGETEVGKAVRVVVFRDGKTKTLMVTLGRREEAENVAFPVAGNESVEPEDTTLFGLTVMPLNNELREQLGVARGTDGLAVVDVDEASEAFAKGLRSGDVIVEAGQEKIASADDLKLRAEDAREAGRKTVLLMVRRAGEPRFVALGVSEE
ncbi:MULTISPECIES: Do family serine endopeptidase [Pacificibacter]|uniref:Do family serine endopeptidase n=1 Tax=Pacificibacter TaxID=1042323 RepID=UPI0020905C3E|nr:MULTISPECIES: Do family serine endopeptidase [Pacificibacter]MDO6614305.1 Do family serine endopeptidase [Pacificibacter sp. 1_MG-2023]